MSDLNKAHIKEIIPEGKRIFVDVGSPSNIIKTAIVMNVMLLVLTITMVFIPLPFFSVIVVILYIISFTLMNIKFSKDFIQAIYHNDNNQIQVGIKKYKNNIKKSSSWDDTVNKNIEYTFNNVSDFGTKSKEIMEKIMDMNKTATSVTGGNRVSGLNEKAKSSNKNIFKFGK